MFAKVAKAENLARVYKRAPHRRAEMIKFAWPEAPAANRYCYCSSTSVGNSADAHNINISLNHNLTYYCFGVKLFAVETIFTRITQVNCDRNKTVSFSQVGTPPATFSLAHFPFGSRIKYKPQVLFNQRHKKIYFIKLYYNILCVLLV